MDATLRTQSLQVVLLLYVVHFTTYVNDKSAFEISWLPNPSAYVDNSTPQHTSTSTTTNADAVRKSLAKFIHRTRPAPN